MREITAETFLRDVAGHAMTVLLDTEIYRHLAFRQPGTGNLWFELLTWPGALTIRGDMGTWTFARPRHSQAASNGLPSPGREVRDMFTFFRDEQLRVNEDYWAEKLQHGTGGKDGARVFYEELFKTQLRAQLTEYYSLEGDKLKEISQALEEDVFSHDDKYELLIAARDFRHGEFYFDSCELPSGKEYAYHFVWCLYAIVWGIQQYDAIRATPAVQEPAE